MELHIGVLLLPGKDERSFEHSQVVQDDLTDFSSMSANGLVQEFNELSVRECRDERESYRKLLAWLDPPS